MVPATVSEPPPPFSDLPEPFGCYIVPLIISILKKVGLVVFILT